MDVVQTQALTRRDLETRLIEKAWRDPVFRKDIVKDPKGMLEKHTGQKLPGQLRIYVHEEDANTLHFSIPSPPSNLNELSDEDLERVAGGTDLVATGIVLAITAASAVGGSALTVGVIMGKNAGW